MRNKKFIVKPEDGVVVGIFTEDNNGFSRIPWLYPPLQILPESEMFRPPKGKANECG